MTLPYRVQQMTVPLRSAATRAFAVMTCSISALEMPIALMGYAALSVERQTSRLTPVVSTGGRVPSRAEEKSGQRRWRLTRGAQIDLILDRADNVINICEMKYTQGRRLLDKASLEGLNEKAEVFGAVSKAGKAMHPTMLTSNGLVDNACSRQIQSEITLADLFAE